MTAIRNATLKVLLLCIFATVLVVLALRWVNPPFSTFILSSPEAHAQQQLKWADWETVSPWLPMAIMAAEDQKFPFHWGFDATAIRQAVMDGLEGHKMRGASTITQQLAKNLFLWPERSWLRKGLEAYFTLLLESLLTKQRILELYINLVEFGPYVFSAAAASQLYFAKPLDQITVQEACLLAAVLPNPRSSDLHRPSQRLKRRADHIREQINALGGTAFLKNL